MSYNLLAQCLLECHPHLYRECSPEDLLWKVRAARLYVEIRDLEPDILCLQEVEVSCKESFFSKLENIGYCGIFKKKTGQCNDGCAIYYKNSIFHLEDQITVEFSQPGFPLLNRDNVGLAVRLRSHPDLPPLVVATTHLLYNRNRRDVRLAQMQLFLAEIDRFAYYQDGTRSGHYPIILTGDLNSPPESAVIKLLDRGHVKCNQLRGATDWRRIGVTDHCQHFAVYLNRSMGIHTDYSMLKIHNSERPPPVYSQTEGPNGMLEAMKRQKVNEMMKKENSKLFNKGELSHGLKLTSVYNHQKATTFQNNWYTVDYIYYSSCSALKLLHRLCLPDKTECLAMGRLPNKYIASDHISLAAIFELAPLASLLPVI